MPQADHVRPSSKASPPLSTFVPHVAMYCWFNCEATCAETWKPAGLIDCSVMGSPEPERSLSWKETIPESIGQRSPADAYWALTIQPKSEACWPRKSHRGHSFLCLPWTAPWRAFREQKPASGFDQGCSEVFLQRRCLRRVRRPCGARHNSIHRVCGEFNSMKVNWSHRT